MSELDSGYGSSGEFSISFRDFYHFLFEWADVYPSNSPITRELKFTRDELSFLFIACAEGRKIIQHQDEKFTFAILLEASSGELDSIFVISYDEQSDELYSRRWFDDGFGACLDSYGFSDEKIKSVGGQVVESLN